MDSQLEVLQARCKVLSMPGPAIRETVEEKHRESNADDPFAFESRGFFLLERTASGAPEGSEDSGDKRETLQSERRNLKHSQQRNANSGKLTKGTGKRARRFVTNWTPEMDKVVRKALAKHGWGCWSRIAQSRKLPKEYNAKLIANRAKSIGLTKEMFGPPVSYTAPRGKD